MLVVDYEGSALILTPTNLKVVEQTIDESLIKSYGEMTGDTDIRFTVSPKITKGLKIRSEKVRETELSKQSLILKNLG